MSIFLTRAGPSRRRTNMMNVIPPVHTMMVSPPTSCKQRRTFREHSVRIERTPVRLHPNCKKHLKKSTKIDAEYNMQT